MKINVLIPLAGKSTFQVNDKSSFPRILNEIDGKLLLEYAAKPFLNLGMDRSITIAVPKKEVSKYQLDKVVPLLGENINTCAINGNTKGAACSALLAIETLDPDSPLIISSFEQVLRFDIREYIETFINDDIDAGVLTFEAIHPKWSFVKTDDNGYVTQAAEKMPISKQAIAGLYYFKSAKLFIESAQSMIRKDIKTNDSFFIAPTLNEIILKEGVVKAIGIDKEKYFHINDEHALDLFEKSILSRNFKGEIYTLTESYVDAFNNKDLASVMKFFASDFVLKDPEVTLCGLDLIRSYISKIFEAPGGFSFSSTNIYVSDDYNSFIEFELFINGKTLLGVDVIKWNKDLEMISMDAYLFEKDDE